MPVLTKQEQPETSCPCEVFRPGCDYGQAGQGANSDRFAQQCANEGCCGYIRSSELSGSLEPCPIPERSEKQSNHNVGREDAEQTVLRPTISLGNTPEQEARTCPRNRKAIQGVPPSVSGFTRSSEPRDSKCSNRFGMARARGLTRPHPIGCSGNRTMTVVVVVLKMSGDGPQLPRQVKTQLPSVKIFSVTERPELCGPNATSNGAHSRGRLTGYP